MGISSCFAYFVFNSHLCISSHVTCFRLIFSLLSKFSCLHCVLKNFNLHLRISSYVFWLSVYRCGLTIKFSSHDFMKDGFMISVNVMFFFSSLNKTLFSNYQLSVVPFLFSISGMLSPGALMTPIGFCTCLCFSLSTRC